MIAYALPTPWRAREQGPHGQPAPLAAGFELVTNGPYHFGRVHRQPASPGPGGQVRQFPAGNPIFGQHFHEAGKGDGAHLKFPAFVGVSCVVALLVLLPKQVRCNKLHKINTFLFILYTNSEYFF